ncbi:hypothetical protein GGH95_004483, partial [Coemansia sp. RSA 1836]
MPLLDHLVTACVLSGYFSDSDSETGADCADGSRKPGHARRLVDAHMRAADHLELVPHTTLDHRMQSLAVGHSSARKAWITHFMEQRANAARDAGAREEDSADISESLEEKARIELMRLTLEWSRSATVLMQQFAWSSHCELPAYADDMRSSIFALWALTPTGSVPLAIHMLSFAISHAQRQLPLALSADLAHSDESVLVANLAALASHALDILLNYRQFQEHVAYHHEQLKALSAGAPASASQALDSDRSAEYCSPHSPWDDMPALTHNLV